MTEFIQTISDLISNQGFPIVCCGALFWYVIKHVDRQHEETEELRKTVEQNTEILKDLKDLINIMIGGKHGQNESSENSADL